MIHIKIQGHVPWYARGTPIIKLRDEPVHTTRGKPFVNWRNGHKNFIRGKPPSANYGKPVATGIARDKIRHWQALKTVISNRQKQLVQPMVCLFIQLTCQHAQHLTTST